MPQPPTSPTAQPETVEDTHTCTLCGNDVREDVAVLLPCCDVEWICPGCDNGPEQTCEACWQSEQRALVRGIPVTP